MKKFVSLRTTALAFVAGYIIQTTCADAGVSFLGVAAGDATNDNVIVWTRAEDESNPQPTTINVQVSDDPTFSTGVTTLPAGRLHRKAPHSHRLPTNWLSSDDERGVVYVRALKDQQTIMENA